ncbi:hypothetical protein C3L33_22369, partial [Rhododendron williamsianum]
MTKPSVPYAYYPTVYQLASNCDVLIICCALTDETRHIINKLVMSALGKEGIIINIARGAIIDEKELVGCLVRGEIAGAGLDVFENEPNVPKELFVIRAAFTEEAFFDAFRLVMDNLEAFFSNRPLLSPVIDELTRTSAVDQATVSWDVLMPKKIQNGGSRLSRGGESSLIGIFLRNQSEASRPVRFAGMPFDG